MSINKKEMICRLLKGIETGDPESVAVVNEEKYVQHNPQTQEGSEGLAVLFKRLSRTNPRVNIVRVFEDGDYVFAHTEYDFSRRNVGFELFRFEDGQAVEHWDNIQKRLGPNQSGHSMVDGALNVADLDKTDSNRQLARSFVNDVLIAGSAELLADFINPEQFVEHNPSFSDQLADLQEAITAADEDDAPEVNYEKCHRILAEGNFVLSICEGYRKQQHSSFFDLYRLEQGLIVEHWDTTESIPPRSEWKNDNGKF